jgi:hypothetical protein
MTSWPEKFAFARSRCAPAFHDMLPPREYDQLGDQFEKRENQLFGEHGFETVVSEVAEIEKRLGIFDLAQFSRPAR